MKKLALGLQTLAAGVVLFGLTCSASAGLVPTFLGETTNGTSSTFIYSVNFTSNAGTGNTETLTSGDFFTLYDVGSVSASTGNFAISQAFTGVTAPFTAPPDSATVLNATGTYSGSTITADTTYSVTLTFPGTLGTTLGYYSSTDTISLGKNSQAGRVTVPVFAVVPEPTTCATLALGAAGLAASALRRRRSA